jgi:23S rRNA U2552 (ribose-2'-O)-methylase RlmE/FtsJ
MTYFLLPRTYSKIFQKIEYSELPSETSPIFISGTLSHFLSSMKEKISSKENAWDIYKKYTNPYEYIHTPIPLKRRSISKVKPISRSYFKMIEMTELFGLLNKYQSINIRSFHLAEGPGGFIEALATLRNNTQDVYYGMTLIDKDPRSNIPTWKKSNEFLGRFPNVILEYGGDKTGNILVLENLRYCKEKYKSSMDIITGDGGFDFSTDFNYQEISIAKLLYGQFAFAVTMQKKGGHFILKIFDSFMKHTLDIIYLLSSFYERVYIVKPKTSRYANSEKYIVCNGFLYDSIDEYYPFIESGFIQMNINEENVSCRFLNMSLPYYFIQKIEEYNSIFGQKQIQNIYYTLLLIDNRHKHDKLDMLIRTNIQKSIDWCIKYNISYNNLLQSSNIFSDNIK